MRRKIWILVCLLAVAAAWFFWPRSSGVLPTSGAPRPAVTTAVSSATNSLSAVKKITGFATGTNRFAFRLTNTKKSLAQLEGDSHAILLQNAFLDTSLPLGGLNIPTKLKSAGDPGAYIVQARGTISVAFRSTLVAAGAQLVSYIPNNAYLVQVSANGAGQLAANSLVQAVLPYEPYYKLQPTLLGLAVQDEPLPPGTGLTLGLFAADAAATEAELVQNGFKIISTDRSPFGPIVNGIAPANWTAIAQLTNVQVVARTYYRKVANDLARVTLGISTDTLVPTNYLNLTGNNVMVEVNDSGIDAAHPDFSAAGTAAGGPSGASRVTADDAGSLFDTSGHGTHVAGVIAGNGAESLTVSNTPQGSVAGADFRGKAPKALLFSVGGIDGGHDGLPISDYYLQAAPAQTNALISNNSWAYAGDFEYDLASASYDAATRDALPLTTGSAPVLFVFAAGNSGNGGDDGTGGDADTILSPGTAKNVITVGAMEQLRNITNIVTDAQSNTSAFWQPETDSSTQIASYSSRGNVGVNVEGSFGRFKPDVVAPGNFVVSTRSEQWDTNAYYNPTNTSVTFYAGQVLPTNVLNHYNISVPPNAVGVTINITSNRLSVPFLTNFFIYAQISAYPDPINAPTLIDITTSNNTLAIPPSTGGAIAGIQSLQNGGFDIAVGNPTNRTVVYDLTISITTTNDLGDYDKVLQALNDTLLPWYRYESGTSIATPAVSGVLALIQDYFTNTLNITPSPALMKAMLINGSRSISGYNYAITNGNNFQGWGLPSIVNSLPLAGGAAPLMGSNLTATNAPLFIVDQNPTNALATGDSHTYIVTLNTNADSFAQFLQLQATLVWTDPAGDPNAAIKLVNNLDLVITNLDTKEVYFGNDILAQNGYNVKWDTNSPPNLDTINNVENIILPPFLAGSYSVTVIGRAVNVNAVTAQANNVVQDYALVVSIGEGEVPNAIASVTDQPVVSTPTTDQLITFVSSTNTPLFNQFVGANSPFVGTNTLGLGTNTAWGSNGQLTVGVTNQWHFYIVTNTGTSANFTNAVFATFNPSTLSIPRMGVYEEADPANATRPEADIDLYATTDPGLTNLSPVTISNCLAGANNSRASLGQGGTEFVYFMNSAPGQVYYIGVKSEDQMASEYDFLPLFTDQPFGQLLPNGDQQVNGLLLPSDVPDGSPAHPGVTNIFAFAIYPMTVQKVEIANQIAHENFGDLVGTLSFNGSSVVLNNHDGFGNTYNTPIPLVYDDSANPITGSRHSDGPGDLTSYRGKTIPGMFILNEIDNSLTMTGQVTQLSMIVQPHRDLRQPGIIVTVEPGSWFIDYVTVPPGYTNLTFYATNLPPTIGPPPLQMYEKFNGEPTFTDYDFEADLTNCLFGTYPGGTDPGNLISVGPPLDSGTYFIGIYNPSLVEAQVFISATLGLGTSAADNFNYANTNGVQTLISDAVTTSPTISVTATQLIQSVSVGMVVTTPQISDYTFTLVSPTGQRILLMENRGGDDTNGAGTTFNYTNILNSTAAGGSATSTNYFDTGQTFGAIPITYNFYSVPDQMTVYYGTNINPATLIFNSGMTNNPAGPTTVTVTYPGTAPASPSSSILTIIMNQYGNSNAVVAGGDQWNYTAGAAITNYQYLTFTDDTNIANVPIKFAAPPYGFSEQYSNFTLSDFELATNGTYQGLTNVYDALGGWTVPTNLVTYTTAFNLASNQFQTVTNTLILTNNRVSVVTDPFDAIGDNAGSNYLALAYGTITRSIPTIPGRIYNVTFWYRGPGIAGWWRGEGNASDSSDPENTGNNGTLVGRFNFPAGKVGQAFQFEDGGDEFRFAGTNAYVQVPQSTSLDVGKGGGFTVEGWINPTNLAQPQPLVEWLARVPTNAADTNTIVIKAGPYLNLATGHYYYMLGSTDWITSEKWAVELGGHLATIDTANEQNWVFDNFANYGGFNHNLWIGLTNVPASTNYIWSSGLTNLIYANWAAGQPTNVDGLHGYTGILGETNLQAGLWVLANTNGFISSPTVTNKFYGVVEVNSIQTNGVQFWISVTNTPNTTNAAFVNSNGCLYANLIDTNYISHEIYSAPGLLQSNTYQHVALTYDTNSGVAMLYLNGTNVATTNFHAIFGPFVPKTDGDVLWGRDMSPYTNNYYAGKMDEMSIYKRALSSAEILGIYQVSTLVSNGVTGKFDPTVTPAVGLAEAEVTFGTTSNLIFGLNNQWSQNSYTFTATSNSMPFQITGLEPGILLDNFSVSQAPLTNLYYLPEQTLDALSGASAFGDWTLQVWDNLNNTAVTNLSQLLSWQLSFVLASNSITAATLLPEAPLSSTVGAGQTVYYLVSVPSWAHFATNILVSASAPVDMLFNPTNVPAATVPANPGDLTLLTASTGGVGVPDLMVNTNPPFNSPNQANQSYYLGIRNPGARAVSVVLQVDYDMVNLTNDVPYIDSLNTNEAVRYYSFDVSTNAYEATFQLLKLSSNADLVVSKGVPLPTLTNSAYGSFNVSNLDENIYVLTNSSPVPLSAGRWYLGVIKRDSGVVNYSILAKELDYTSGELTNSLTIINLTNGVPFNYTATPGAALTNFFVFHATNSLAVGMTNIPGVRFELYNLTGNGDLTVQTNAPPLAPPFFQTSHNLGRNPELILIYTNSVLTNVMTDWYLGVPNNEIGNIRYTIIAVIETNSYFPAFPGAAGAGGGAVGGRFGSVYHVTTTADSGPGSLRAAVNIASNTVVFDVSGTITLASPLVITNSYLTIVGQTAPGGGITVAGQMTTVTNAHDVVIRNVRFRPGSAASQVIMANSFEGSSTEYSIGVGNYFAGGWYVSSGNVDLLSHPSFPSSPPIVPYDGTNCVDMNGGTSPGTISTNVTTVVGQSYTLSLAYAQSPDGRLVGQPIASLNILQNGNLLKNLTVQDTTNTWGNMGWATTSIVFTATSPSTQISFASQTPGASGMVIDAVKLMTTAVGDGDALQFINASNVITDHISASWSRYDLISAFNSTNVTVQWSILADSLLVTNNPAPLGSLLRYGGGGLSFHHNLYADNYSGNPRLGDNISLDFVNNVIYDWGIRPGFSSTNDDILVNTNGFTNQLNYVCNYLIAGPDTAFYATNLNITNIAFVGGTTNTWIFQTNNFIDSNTNGILDGADTKWTMFTNQYTPFQHPFTSIQVPTDEAFLAYEKVLDFAGVNAGFRDSVDTDIAYKIRTQTGRIISTSLSDMVAWWKGEGNANDSVGANNGSFLGSASYTNGEVGTAFLFNGANNGVRVPASASLDVGLGGGITIEAWVAPFQSTNDNPIVEWNDGTGANYGSHFWLSHPNFGTGNFFANLVDTGGNWHVIQSPPGLIVTNIYQHVAVTYDKASGNAALYYNGTQVAAANLGTFTLQTSYPLYIGERPPGDVNSSVFTGSIDEVSLYNHALSAGEITAIYTAGHAGKFQTQSGQLFLDTDQDGIPDFWEKTFGTDPFTPNNGQLSNLGDGYTYLEEYNNWLAGPHVLTVTTNPVSVDLKQLFGNTGNLSFFVTNGVKGVVYLTNVWGTVTNTGQWSNSFAVFMPTNNPLFAPTNFSGHASFGVYVTNNDTIASFGPVMVDVVASAVPLGINSNVPPVIITLSNSVAYANTNFGGTDFYKFTVTTNSIGSNAIAALFSVTNASGPVVLVARYGLPLPSLSSYDYISTNSWTTSENILVLSNSTPVALANGDWYLAVVNVAGSNVTYSVKASEFYSIVPPLFTSPTNNSIFTNLETTLFTQNCSAIDTNAPPLPLTYALVSGDPTNMTIGAASGVINWTPTEAQGPSTNAILVSVSNGYFTVTNNFTVIVTESNLPPVLPSIPDQIVVLPNTLIVTNTATDPDVPANVLTYVLLNAPGAALIDTNSGIITWTPTLADLGSNYLFTTVVTDTNPWAVNAKSLSATNSFHVTVAQAGSIGGQPQTNVVPAGGIDWFQFVVPTNAIAATNQLLFATNLPVNVWFSTNVPPTVTNSSDTVLFPNATNGFSVLITNSAPTNIVPGGIYFLGVQNPAATPVTFALAVNFAYAAPSAPVVISNVSITTNGVSLQWAAPTNQQFKVQWTTNIVPPVIWTPFPNTITSTTGMFNFTDTNAPLGIKFYQLLLLP